MTTATFKPSEYGDDGYLTGASLITTNQYVSFGYQSLHAFCRFQNVTIPRNATIVSAKITLQAYSGIAVEPCNLNCYFNDSDDAVAPTDATTFNALALTAAVAWDNLGGTTPNVDFDTPSLSSILQGIVNRVGWVSGNGVMVIIKDNLSVSGASRNAKAMENSFTLCPRLIVEYEYTATPEIDASIVISPQFSGTILKGGFGDIYSSIVIAPQFSATARVEPVLSTSIVISPSVSGTINKALTPELEGTVVISPQISGTMNVSNLGDCTISLPMFTLLATGAGEYLGNGDLYIPVFTLSAEGYDNALGEGTLILPMLSLIGLSQVNDLGEATLVLPRLRLVAEGNAGVLGYGSIILPMFTLFAGTLFETIGEASLSVPLFIISGEGADGAVGNGAITIPVLAISTSAYMSTEGTANLTIPMLVLFAENLTAATDFLNQVMNVRNNALTLYTNYPFNSLCRFNGKNLGATATGIYDLDSGDTDDGSLIEWNFRTGYLDLEQKMKKKITQAWMSYKSDGDLIVTIVQPNGEEYEYPLGAVDVTESGIRAVFGKGIKSKYVAVDIKNVDGSSITLDVLRLQFDQFTKKR